MQSLRLTEYGSKLRGGAQSHLMKASDDNYYVVKFRDNPQGTRILANELLASNLANLFGLPVADARVVELDEKLLAAEAERLRFELPYGNRQIQAGLHVGCRYAIDPLQGRVFDFVPTSFFSQVRNLEDFWGVYLFDGWICNLDVRQAVYWRLCKEKKLRVCFIDQGHCFGGPEWRIRRHLSVIPKPDHPAFAVLGSQSSALEEWLRRIENLSDSEILTCASHIPEEWYGSQRDAMYKLVEALISRKSQLRLTLTESINERSSCRTCGGLKRSVASLPKGTCTPMFKEAARSGPFSR